MKRKLPAFRAHVMLMNIVFLVCVSLLANAQKKIVGYVAKGSSTSIVDFTRVTHLMLYFENPDAAGDLSWTTGSAALVTAAHNNNVKVLVSLCGAASSEDATIRARYTSLMSAANRDAWITKIIAYLNANNLDGLDLDLEASAINANYNTFVPVCKSRLQAAGKILTCALSHTNNGDAVNSTAAQAFDFLGVMAYDHAEAGDPNHSSYNFAVVSANWWVVNRGVLPERIVLGVPFYSNGAATRSFKDIVSSYGSAAAQADSWATSSGTIYYNGIPTIRNKAQLVVDKNYGGIMIWQLAMDATGTQYALVPNIKDVLSSACSVPAQPSAINGNASVATGSSNTYSIAAVSGASSYTWTLPAGWSGSSTSTSITTTAGSAGGTISVSANNACGAGNTRSLSVTVGTSGGWTANYYYFQNVLTADYARPTDGSATANVTQYVSAALPSAYGSTMWSFVNAPTSGYYHIVNRATGNAIRPIDGATTDGTAIGQYALDATSAAYASMQWSIEASTTQAGTYWIKNRASGRYIRPQDGADGNGIAIVQNTLNAAYGSFSWNLVSAGPKTAARTAQESMSRAPESSAYAAVNIYPNPASSTLHIETSDFQEGFLNITDATGKNHISRPLNDQTIDIRSLPSGLYIVRLVKGRRSVSTKFIKE